MSKSRKPSGRNVKRDSVLWLTRSVDTRIERRVVKSDFDSYRAWLASSFDEAEQKASRRMNLDNFVKQYITDLEWGFWTEGMDNPDYTQFIDDMLAEYTNDLMVEEKKK